MIGIISTPTSAPVLSAIRLRKGSTNSARGAARLVAETLLTAKRAGAGTATGALVLARMDSAFYNADVVGAVRRQGAGFFITARMDRAVQAAIGSIDDAA